MTNKQIISHTEKSFAEYCDNNQVQLIKQDQVNLSKDKPRKVTPARVIQDDVPELLFFDLSDASSIKSEYCNDGQHKVVKDLRNGKYRVLDSLDLHNYTQGQALVALEQFIDHGVTEGNTCLKIIHGKGLNSPDGNSVIKLLLRRYLSNHPRLIAYSKAQECNGGDGVTLVKLKNIK